jgi:hypothetical protein
MKREILARPVFSGEKNPEAENVGIMQGFLDILVAEEEPENEEEDVAQLLGRTVDSPEIIMNNLRGDMRSVDARREELADMVGYNAAMETPDEVLALLQNKIAENEKTQGLGALMPSGGMPTPPMMPPQGMPPPPMMPPQGMMPPPQDPMGMPPQNPMPINMKEGGIVQNFRNGSLPSGVTPIVQRFANGTGPKAAQQLEKTLKDDPLYQAYQLSQTPITTADLETQRAGLSSLIPRDDTLKNLALAQSFAKFGRTGDLFGTIEESTPTFAQIAQQDAAREQKLGELAYSSALAKRKGMSDLLTKLATRKKFELIPETDPVYKSFHPSVVKFGLQRNKLTGEIKPIIAPPSTVIGGGETKLQEQVIKEVPDLLQEVQTIQSDLSRLDESIGVLKDNPDLVGDGQAIIGMIPYFGQGMQDLALLAEDKFGGSTRGREAIALQNNILSVINRSMKALLGAQFTEREGERIIKASFNRALSPEQVLSELGRLRLSLKTGLDFKIGQLKILSDRNINPLDMANKVIEINSKTQNKFLESLDVPKTSSKESSFGRETDEVDLILEGKDKT